MALRITQSTVGDWMMGRATFEQALFQSDFAGMGVLRSTATLTAEIKGKIFLNVREVASDGERMPHFKVLQKAVDSIRDRFDTIIIDTPPTFSLLFTNSIFASDAVLIPSKLEFLSIRAIGPLLLRIRDVQEYNPI